MAVNIVQSKVRNTENWYCEKVQLTVFKEFVQGHDLSDSIITPSLVLHVIQNKRGPLFQKGLHFVQAQNTDI